MPGAVTTDRLYTADDAVNAAIVLREADAGHEYCAEVAAAAFGLADLTNDDLRNLCTMFRMEV